MNTMFEQIAELEAQAAALRRQIATAPCRDVGCDMRCYGGCNAGCELGDSCGCSVPVNVCLKCGDSDYGDNSEAHAVRRNCKEGRS